MFLGINLTVDIISSILLTKKAAQNGQLDKTIKLIFTYLFHTK